MRRTVVTYVCALLGHDRWRTRAHRHAEAGETATARRPPG